LVGLLSGSGFGSGSSKGALSNSLVGRAIWSHFLMKKGGIGVLEEPQSRRALEKEP
jgi:hypothetical protein